jgi:hypothetical protein
MKIAPILAGAAAMGVALSPATSTGSGYIFSNLGYIDAIGCGITTECSPTPDNGNVFAAQLFTLNATAVINSGQWSQYSFGGFLTTANYAFYSDAGGLPGTLLYSGSSPETDTILDQFPPYYQFLISFPIPSIELPAGSYFFAFQSSPPQLETYLQQGWDNAGAAETKDGGVTWVANYGGRYGLYGLSVALTGDVPEPSTWAMMLLAFAGLGFAGYRSRGARINALA